MTAAFASASRSSSAPCSSSAPHLPHLSYSPCILSRQKCVFIIRGTRTEYEEEEEEETHSENLEGKKTSQVLLRHWEKRNAAPPNTNTSSSSRASWHGTTWKRGSKGGGDDYAAGYPLLGGAPAAPRLVFFDGADAATGAAAALPGPSTTQRVSSSSDEELEEEAEREGVSPSQSRRHQRQRSQRCPPLPPPLYPPHLSHLTVAPNARFLADHLDSNRKQGAMFLAAAANGPLGASARDTEARAVALGLPALAAKNIRRNAREQGEATGGFLRVALREGGRELAVVCRLLEGADEVPAARAALEARLQIAAARRRAA